MQRKTLIATTLSVLIAGVTWTAIAQQSPDKSGPGMQPAMRHAMQADANKDGRISRDEWLAEFARKDVNKDGFLDAGDRQAMAKARRDEHFARMDGNKDGRVTRVEFDAAFNAMHAHRMQQRAERMAAGGKTDMQRPMPSEAERKQHMGEMFARMDGNKDGTITRAEFDALQDTMMRGDKHRDGRRGASR